MSALSVRGTLPDRTHRALQVARHNGVMLRALPYAVLACAGLVLASAARAQSVPDSAASGSTAASAPAVAPAGVAPAGPAAAAAAVQTVDAAAPDEASPEQWAIHGQATNVWLLQPTFHAPYSGPQSLDRSGNGRETLDTTLYLGLRPWQGAEIWINPEMDQGFGLSNSFGVAGYISGEAYKVGEASPYYRMPRGFFRQTINLGGDSEKVDPDLNQLGGSQTADRVVITVGKYSVVDIFDTNKYAHDPRNDFFNWSIIDLGTFDYAAEAWGYTYGAAVEWYQDWWTIRVGLFDLSAMPNDTKLDNRFLQQAQFVTELEERHTLWDQPGKFKMLYWLIRGNLGTYSSALALAAATGQTPSTAAVRSYRSKAGFGVNLEQQITTDLGMFLRAGVTEGNVEEVDFTDIDQSVSAGLSLTGARWDRPDDTVGLAAVANQASHQAKLYFAAGGLGGIIGDGQLPQAGPEQIIETYYRFAAFSFAQVTADYQFIRDPAYNRQRGPVSVFGIRLHAEF